MLLDVKIKNILINRAWRTCFNYLVLLFVCCFPCHYKYFLKQAGEVQGVFQYKHLTSESLADLRVYQNTNAHIL